MIKNKMMMFLSIMLLSFATVSYAQSVSLPDTTVAAGTTVNLPIKVSNLSKVGAISLAFNYNTTALTYKGFVASPDLNVNPDLVKEATAGSIKFAWYATSSVNITNGVIGYLTFTLKSGKGDVKFDQALCELSAIPFANINATFKDGSIGEPAAQPAALTVGSLEAKKGDTVSVALSATSLKNIGSLSLTVNYSTSALKFVGFANNVNSFTVPTANTDGKLNIGWISTTGKDFDGKLIDVKFVLLGGTSTVSVSGEVTNPAAQAVAVLFNPGTITEKVAPPPVVGLSLGAVRATANKTVTVPMMVTEVSKIGSLSLKLKYDAAVLAFKEIKNFAGTGSVTTGETNGTLTLGYANTTPVTVTNGKLMDVVFTYKGGTTDVTFDPTSEITDDKGTTITAITYTKGNVKVNAAPVMTKVADQTVKENEKLTFDVAATDVENDPVAFTAGTLPKGATFATKTFTWTPGYTDAGTYNVTFFATDSLGALDSTVAKIVVTNVNRKPAFTAALKDTAIGENQKLTFTYKASDPDNDAVTLSVKSAPAGSTFDAATGVFTWTPDFGKKGIYTVVIGVTDGNLADSTTAKVTVNFTNRAPVFSAMPKDTVLYLKASTKNPYYSKYSFTYKATDPDNDAVKYYLTAGPAGAKLDSVTGVFEYTLATNVTYDGKITVTIKDVNGASAVNSINFKVAVMVSVENEAGIPSEYALKQNFPNPFNPTTNIKYALPKESRVSLRVYNLIGQEVKVLVNQVQPAGNYIVDFNAANLPSGIYIYRLDAGTFNQTRKMTLLK